MTYISMVTTLYGQRVVWTKDIDTGKVVYVEVTPACQVVKGFPWWAGVLGKAINGLTRFPFIHLKDTPGNQWSFWGLLHELGHWDDQSVFKDKYGTIIWFLRYGWRRLFASYHTTADEAAANRLADQRRAHWVALGMPQVYTLAHQAACR